MRLYLDSGQGGTVPAGGWAEETLVWPVWEPIWVPDCWVGIGQSSLLALSHCFCGARQVLSCRHSIDLIIFP